MSHITRKESGITGITCSFRPCGTKTTRGPLGVGHPTGYCIPEHFARRKEPAVGMFSQFHGWGKQIEPLPCTQYRHPKAEMISWATSGASVFDLDVILYDMITWYVNQHQSSVFNPKFTCSFATSSIMISCFKRWCSGTWSRQITSNGRWNPTIHN